MGSGIACLIGALVFYTKRKKNKTAVADLTSK
jgi:LPXTG-motif cell wall-anchored protein